MTEHAVVFQPAGRRGRFADGTTVLAAARALGVDLDSVCGGRGICGRCQIVPAGPVSPPNAVEERYRDKRGLAPGRRLGCQTMVAGNLTVEVPPDSQLHRQVVRKRAEEHAIALDPVVTLHAVEVRQPDMHDPASDARRLADALREQWAIDIRPPPLAVLAGLQQALRSGDWLVTAAVRRGGDLVALYPGVRERVAGLAFDIGSTTIAAHLCDLRSGEVLASGGVMNPQIRWGDDLMSRVSAAMMDADAAPAMTAAVRHALDALAGALAAEAGIERDEVVEAVAVGNPVMHHLFLGLDPTALGQAPFALTVDEALDIPAAALGLKLAPGAQVHLLPCIAGHVGADAAAVVLAEAPDAGDALTLLVDIGTNAEIVLGDRRRLTACSSPTGPAFEGAQLSAGQRAAPGAIERVRVDPETLEPRFQVIGCALWSDEPGFAAAVAPTGVTGICGSGVVDALAELFLAGVLRTDGTIDGAAGARSARVVPDGRTFSFVLHPGPPVIAITQGDVRAIQLAKAALQAGARLLMDRFPGRAPDAVKLAGAFGSHIDPLRALVLGLVPDCAPERITAVGNAAGTGARIALLNAGSRQHIAALVRRIEKIETAVEPDFQRHFVGAMALPHASEPYPFLAAAVPLPEQAAPERRRRRSR